MAERVAETVSLWPSHPAVAGLSLALCRSSSTHSQAALAALLTVKPAVQLPFIIQHGMQ